MKLKDLRKLSKLSGEQIAVILIGEAEVLYPEMDDTFYDNIGTVIENVFAKGLGKIANNKNRKSSRVHMGFLSATIKILKFFLRIWLFLISLNNYFWG